MHGLVSDNMRSATGILKLRLNGIIRLRTAFPFAKPPNQRCTPLNLHPLRLPHICNGRNQKEVSHRRRRCLWKGNNMRLSRLSSHSYLAALLLPDLFVDRLLQRNLPGGMFSCTDDVPEPLIRCRLGLRAHRVRELCRRCRC